MSENEKAVADLVAAVDRVLAAFRALGQARDIGANARCTRECEDSMLALDEAQAQAKAKGLRT